MLHSVVDTLSLDRTKNILVYTINPNDCISCINGFRSLKKDISPGGNGQLIVVSVARQIEKEELSRRITDIDLSSGTNRSVLWSKDLFDGINTAMKMNSPLSLVTIYNYEKDSVIFCRPIREVSDEREVSDALKKEL